MTDGCPRNSRPARGRFLPPFLLAALAALLLTALPPPSARACGIDSDCDVGGRTYRVSLPATFDPAKRPGAILFIHGYRGTAEGVMRHKELLDMASRLGLVFVAAQAAGREWTIPNAPKPDPDAAEPAANGVPALVPTSAAEAAEADEFGYFAAVVADIGKRFNVDPKKVVVTGFSSGAMTVWDLACYRGDLFAGFVPMSGTFWAPVPASCPSGPVTLIHYHATEDKTVPLHGRAIGKARQGDVYEAMAMMRTEGAYEAEGKERLGDMTCEEWRESAGGHRLELCLFAGGHMFRVGNLERAVGMVLEE